MATQQAGDTAVVGRIPAAIAAFYGGLGVALSAYAAHGASGQRADWLGRAALFLLLHAPVVIALLGRRGRLLAAARIGLLLGVTLFSGSLVGGALLDLPTKLAPAGGTLLILSWLLLAVALLRGEGRAA